MDSQEEADVFENIIALSQTTFANNHHETAYHLLAAATHYARDVASIPYLTRINDLLNEQRTLLNKHHPESRLSSVSVKKRMGVDLYESLAVQIRAAIVIIKMDEKRAKHNPSVWLENKDDYKD